MVNTEINQNGEQVVAGKLNAVDRLAIREEIRAIQKGTGRSAWYNPSTGYEVADNGERPEPETVYLGEAKGAPTWGERIFHMPTFRETLKARNEALKSGSKFDWGKFGDPWLDDWKRVSEEYDYLKETKRIKSAAVGTNSDFAAIDVVNVLAQMVNLELRTFTLDQAVTTIGTPQLNLRVDTGTRFVNSQGVPEGEPPLTKRIGVTRASYDLTKDVGHMSMTDEAQLRAVHDIWKLSLEVAATDMKRLISNKIATELETATGVTGADWSAFTTDHNTTAPQINIGTAADTVFANNGAANVITSHDKIWRYFTMSTFIKGLLQAIPLPDLSLAKVITNVPALPGFTWYADNEHTSTLACVFDKSAVYFMQGPIRGAQYRLEQEGIDGYVYRNWNLPKIIIGGRIRKITGVG